MGNRGGLGGYVVREYPHDWKHMKESGRMYPVPNKKNIDLYERYTKKLETSLARKGTKVEKLRPTKSMADPRLGST